MLPATLNRLCKRMHGARVTCVTASNRVLTHGSGSHNARYVPTSAFPSTHKDTGPTYLQIFSFVRTLPDWLCEISTYTFVRQPLRGTNAMRYRYTCESPYRARTTPNIGPERTDVNATEETRKRSSDRIGV